MTIYGCLEDNNGCNSLKECKYLKPRRFNERSDCSSLAYLHGVYFSHTLHYHSMHALNLFFATALHMGYHTKTWVH
jgi:hypothetical protein